MPVVLSLILAGVVTLLLGVQSGAAVAAALCAGFVYGSRRRLSRQQMKKARTPRHDLSRKDKTAIAAPSFLSSMSHELRTPLNAINGFSQLLLKTKKNPLNDKQREMVGQIASAGEHLLSLVNEILDLARIDAGQLSLALEAIDASLVLADCLALTEPLAEKQQISMVKHCPPGLPKIRADRTRTKQILLNLISNAIKYNRQGGMVEIFLAADNNGYLRCTVTDTGTGVPLEKQGKLFAPFSRLLDNPNSIEGTGIGLAITRQLVEAMGGGDRVQEHAECREFILVYPSGCRRRRGT